MNFCTYWHMIQNQKDPGQSCPAVNGRTVVNYVEKRSKYTLAVYSYRIRRFTSYYGYHKQLTLTVVVYGSRNYTPTVNEVRKIT